MSEKKGEYKVKRGTVTLPDQGEFPVVNVVILTAEQWDEIQAKLAKLARLEYENEIPYYGEEM